MYGRGRDPMESFASLSAALPPLPARPPPSTPVPSTSQLAHGLYTGKGATALPSRCYAGAGRPCADSSGKGRYLPPSQCEQDPSLPLSEEEVERAIGAWLQGGLTAHALLACYDGETWTDEQAWLDQLTDSLTSPPYSLPSPVCDSAGHTALSLALNNPHLTGHLLHTAIGACLAAPSTKVALPGVVGPIGQTVWHLLVLRELQQHDVQWEEWLPLLAQAAGEGKGLARVHTGAGMDTTDAGKRRRPSRSRLSLNPTPPPCMSLRDYVSAGQGDALGRSAWTYVRHRLPDGLVQQDRGAAAHRSAVLDALTRLGGIPCPPPRSSLHAAIGASAVKEMKAALLDAASTINEQDVDGYTAFHLALVVEGKKPPMDRLVPPVFVRLLSSLPPGAALVDVSMPSYEGATPLLTAVETGQVEAVQLICSVSPSSMDLPVFRSPPGVHAFTRAEPSWPLLLAAKTGSCATVDALLQAGASLRVVNEYGEGALAISLDAGHEKVASLLLAWGADPRQEDHAGNVPADIVRTQPTNCPARTCTTCHSSVPCR